jgi:hypothetical protein
MMVNQMINLLFTLWSHNWEISFYSVFILILFNLGSTWAYALESAKLQQSDFGKHRLGWIHSANDSSTVLIESQDEISLLGLGVSFIKLKSNSFFGIRDGSMGYTC